MLPTRSTEWFLCLSLFVSYVSILTERRWLLCRMSVTGATCFRYLSKEIDLAPKGVKSRISYISITYKYLLIFKAIFNRA